MSGGYFDYKQYILNEVANIIEHEIQKGENKHSEIIVNEMDHLVYDLRKIADRLHDLDWYLSGDDGQDDLEKKIVKRRKI